MSRRLVVVSPDESVIMAWELMRRSGFHHLPVVDDDGRCIGVLDVETVATEWDAGGPGHARRPVSAFIADRRFPRVRPEDPIHLAARAMAVDGVDAVPVRDERGRLIGLVTTRDLMAGLAGVTREEWRATNTPYLFRMQPLGEEPTRLQFPPGRRLAGTRRRRSQA